MAHKEKTKTMPMSVRMAPSIKAAAERAAALEHRSVTNFIEYLIITHCRQQGVAVGEENSDSEGFSNEKK